MSNDNTGFSVSQFLTQGPKKKSTSDNYGKDKKSSKMSYNANRNKKKVVASKENNNKKNNNNSNNSNNNNLSISKDKGNTKIKKQTKKVDNKENKTEKVYDENIANKDTGSTRVKKTRTTVSKILNPIVNVNAVEERSVVNQLPIDAENHIIPKNHNNTLNHKFSQKDNKENRVNRENKEKELKYQNSKVKIIPLGGIEEVGKNITAFEFEDDIIIVDCGLAFPEDDMLGIDIVLPDFTYIEKNINRVRGLIVTHGHEDHIGAIPYLLKKVNIPIYATRLTIGLISNKLEEHHLKESSILNVCSYGDIVHLGLFDVEFIGCSHSIPDSAMLAIHTPAGVLVHTGDFKVDFTPIDNQTIDFGRLAELGNKGVLALLSDSTNAERKGYTLSERTVGEVLERAFIGCNKRIVVATFASNVHRVQQIVNCAVLTKRKIAICGRSMINMINTAMDLGYIDCPKEIFIDIDMVQNYPDEQLVIITTGSQGETMSALTRMANGEHRKIKLTPNDLVIISANPIPGNEAHISKVIDQLMKIGADVIYSVLQDVHVSGHACQEEQKMIISLVRPKYFIPVHGEYRHLIAHSETAKSLGYDYEHILLMSNGRVLELNNEMASFTGTVQVGKIMVDGLGVGDVGSVVLRDRQHLSQDGLIIVVLTMASNGSVMAGPDVITRGFVYVRESENLMDDIKQVVSDEVARMEAEGITDWTAIKSTIKDTLRAYITKKTKRDPMILPILMEV